MLKSLEKLRDGGIWGEDSFGFSKNKAKQLADEIQAEIDRFYLPRPLFDDGEPVQIGDYVDLQCEGKRRVQVTDIQPWIVYGSSTSHQREPYKRPPEPDTQEKIDEDFQLTVQEYCDKHGIDVSHDPDYVRDDYPELLVRRHLLERQRKLDGVEQ